MVFINPFILVSLLATFGFFFGLLVLLSEYEGNKCEMTYMFQYPQFVRISNEADTKFKKYGLYSYSEGHLTEQARKMQFTGIPVLFIPGNAGSYKQVRSLASIALRKAINSKPGFHFDYFTIDFNEELSAMNGALLEDQVMYSEQAVYRVLELYTPTAIPPLSVILVGHSMGGIIAEALLSVIPYRDMIALIVTLATPHSRPPLFFDVRQHHLYNSIKTWDNRMNTTFITIFGGFDDFLVPPHLTTSKHLNVATTHIPKVWIPMDHLCILWCKQLALVLNRALFDSVDVRTRHISVDKEYVISAFKHHLVHNSGIKIHQRDKYDLPTLIDPKGEWIEYLPRQYSVHLTDGSRPPHWYMIRKNKAPMHEILSILSVNLELTNWIYGCNANVIRGQSRVCVDGMHLSHLSEIVPSVNYKRRFLNVNLHELSDNFTHVVVKVPTTSDPITLHVDVHSEADRKIIVKLPAWFLPNEHVVIEETSENTLYYELHFPDLNSLAQSYKLKLVPLQCKSESHHASARLSVPWSNLDYHVIFTENRKKAMDLRLYSRKPPRVEGSPVVKLILDPNCRYTVRVRLDIGGTFAQFVRYYYSLVFGNIAVVVLLTFKWQLSGIGSKEKCPLFFTALMTGTKPFYIIPVAKISALVLGSTILSKILLETDMKTLDNEGIGFIATIFLYTASIGIVWFLAVALSISIFFFESTMNNILLNVLSRTVAGTIMTHDWLLKGLKKFPAFVAVLLISLSMSTCGGLALCLGLIFYYLKLTQMAQDVVESVVIKLVEVVAEKLKIRPHLREKILSFLRRATQAEVNTETNTESDNENRENEIESSSQVLNESTADGASTSQDNIANEIKESGETANVNDENSMSTNESTENLINAERDESGPEENLNSEEEDSLFSKLGEIAENNELYFHFSIFCLWFLVTCVNIPTVLTWAHNFKYSSKLHDDPSFMPAIVLCSCALALWQFEYPKVSRRWYKEMSYIVYVLLVLAYLYAMVSIYRLNYILTGVIALVTLHQLLAPNKVEVSASANPSDDSPYDKAKVKWE